MRHAKTKTSWAQNYIVFAIAISNTLVDLGDSGSHPTCTKPLTFSYVHDATSQVLCSLVSGTARAPDGGSKEDCLRYCAYSLPVCIIYTYYEDSMKCEVFDYVCRYYVVKPGCVSYHVSNRTILRCFSDHNFSAFNS